MPMLFKFPFLSGWPNVRHVSIEGHQTVLLCNIIYWKNEDVKAFLISLCFDGLLDVSLNGCFSVRATPVTRNVLGPRGSMR